MKMIFKKNTFEFYHDGVENHVLKKPEKAGWLHPLTYFYPISRDLDRQLYNTAAGGREEELQFLVERGADMETKNSRFSII
jgi:hypothetical protein